MKKLYELRNRYCVCANLCKYTCITILFFPPYYLGCAGINFAQPVAGRLKFLKISISRGVQLGEP